MMREDGEDSVNAEAVTGDPASFASGEAARVEALGVAGGESLDDTAVPAEPDNLYALSWRSKASGILHEVINFRARDEGDLLNRVNERFPRENRIGKPGPSLGAGARRVADDPDDSLQWVWQRCGLSLRETRLDLSHLCSAQALPTR